MAQLASFVCLCGREFAQQNAYGKHQHFCQKSKKRLANVLGKANSLFKEKKKWHLEGVERTSLSTAFPTNSDSAPMVPLTEVCLCAMSL